MRFVLTYFLALLLTGKLSRFDSQPRHGPVYAETFAIWLALFVMLSLISVVVSCLVVRSKHLAIDRLLASSMVRWERLLESSMLLSISRLRLKPRWKKWARM